MARITDDSKLEAVKKSLVDIIIRDGSSNASIAKVAKEAKVSSGYLYRHYTSKEELINELLFEEFEKLSHILTQKIIKHTTLEQAILGYYTKIIEKVKEDENEILFVLKMMTDYSIKIPDGMRDKLLVIIDLFRDKFKNEINQNIQNEQLYIQILGSILMFVNLRKRGVLKQSEITQNDIQLLTVTTINALK